MLLPKRGFYHPVAILVLAAITLSFAIIFYLNSSVFFKAPEQTPQPNTSKTTEPALQTQTKTSPSPSFQTTPNLVVKPGNIVQLDKSNVYTNDTFKFSITYPKGWFLFEGDFIWFDSAQWGTRTIYIGKSENEVKKQDSDKTPIIIHIGGDWGDFCAGCDEISNEEITIAGRKGRKIIIGIGTQDKYRTILHFDRDYDKPNPTKPGPEYPILVIGNHSSADEVDNILATFKLTI